MTLTEPDAPIQEPLPIDAPESPSVPRDFKQDPEARELIDRSYQAAVDLMVPTNLTGLAPEHRQQIEKWVGKNRRCRAWSKSRGQQCSSPALAGMAVCRVHGGNAPQVKRKATERLNALSDPAVAALAKELVNPNATPSERIKAADSILDRTGYGRGVSINTDDATSVLATRLYAAAQERNLIPARDSEDIVIIPDEDDHGIVDHETGTLR